MCIHFLIQAKTMAEELKFFLFFIWGYSIKLSKPAATRVLSLPQLSCNSAYNSDAILTNTALQLVFNFIQMYFHTNYAIMEHVRNVKSVKL